MIKRNVYLMKTNFNKGTSEVVEKYEKIPPEQAARMALAQQKRLNAECKKHFYWVKFINW